PAILPAQPWSPVNKTEKSNFRLESATIISHVICVDSAKGIGGDSVFYLNRVVKRCTVCPDTNYFLKNQPQFLLREMVKRPGGDYVFRNPGSFLIKTMAETGQSWLFDTAAALTAQVTQKSWNQVLGEWDSIKTITLSNGQFFLLSKEHGLLWFPVFGQNDYYNLEGISGRNLGTQLPGFREVYNFKVGDVFQYDNFWMHYGLGEGGERLIKRRILGKDSTAEGYEYLVENRILFWEVSVIGATGPKHHDYQLNTWTLVDSSDHVCNLYPGQLIDDPVGEGSGWNASAASVIADTGGIVSRFAGSADFPVCSYGTGDTLLPYLAPWEFSHKFSATLGEVWYLYNVFEIYSNYRLIGYIKNGDTTGIIYPDDSILQPVRPVTPDQRLIVFPNPASGKLNVHLPEYTGKKVTIELFNQQGIPVRKDTDVTLPVTLDVAGLTPGIYMMIVRGDGLFQSRKVVVRRK
ncbi:MAG TPA: T9SS type A sorting domain-containing protein, partial [Bacteroidales bacterium]|nr:T9SS type A sorting domain-containing protein [Bacteroidales bacterium]